MEKFDRNKYIEDLIYNMDNCEDTRNKMFKSIYGGVTEEMHDDWKKCTHKEKKKFLSKSLRDEDFYLIMSVLQQAKGNPFKAYKLLKEAKKNERNKQN